MRRLIIAPLARVDIAAALPESRRAFGPQARAGYRRLIDTALGDLIADPDRPGTHAVEIEGVELGCYHLRNSRLRVPTADRISRPRHIVIFSHDIRRVTVVRVLHDSMDLARHIDPPE